VNFTRKAIIVDSLLIKVKCYDNVWSFEILVFFAR